MPYVYFIQAEMPDGLIKIGVAKDPQGRMAHFTAGSPIPLKLLYCIEGTVKLERTLHKRFATLRRHGEWFFPGEELLSFLGEIEKADTEQRESLMTVGEAAAFAGTTDAHIRQLCTNGSLSPVYTPGGHRRFREEQILHVFKPGISFP